MRRHSELDEGVRRTLERRIRAWRAIHEEQEWICFGLVESVLLSIRPAS